MLNVVKQDKKNVFRKSPCTGINPTSGIPGKVHGHPQRQEDNETWKCESWIRELMVCEARVMSNVAADFVRVCSMKKHFLFVGQDDMQTNCNDPSFSHDQSMSMTCDCTCRNKS